MNHAASAPSLPAMSYRNAGCLPQLTLSGECTHNGKRERDFGRITRKQEVIQLA